MAKLDDYLDCKAYLGKEIDPTNNSVTKFFDDLTQKYYFAIVENQDTVLLKSEGYTTAKSRDNGIKSVLKNSVIKENFSIVSQGKQYVLVLKAGNNQEIAVSCNCKTKIEAENILAKLTEAKSTDTSTSIKVAKSKVTKKSKVSKSIDEPTINFNDFLNIDDYLNRDRISDSYGLTGFVKFRHQNGKYYFGVYNPDGSLYLRSKGYEDEMSRENAFDLMESSILLEENYKVENINGNYYSILFEYNEVLAVSGEFDSFINAFVTTPGGRPKEIVGTMY